MLSNAIVHAAVRCPDPSLKQFGGWVVRRLAPDCSRVELADLSKERDEMKLVHAMGRETANVHLGTGNSGQILKHLSKRPEKWLSKASSRMADHVAEDHAKWKDR